MGPYRDGVDPAASQVRSWAWGSVLAVIAAALMLHLFGPGLQASGAASSRAHGHSSLDDNTAHSSDAAVESVAEAHQEESCHSVVGFTPATSAMPMIPCFGSSGRSDVPLTSDRSGLRPAWIGGEGGDASLDPRRSPGVQRT